MEKLLRQLFIIHLNQEVSYYISGKKHDQFLLAYGDEMVLGKLIAFLGILPQVQRGLCILPQVQKKLQKDFFSFLSPKKVFSGCVRTAFQIDEPQTPHNSHRTVLYVQKRDRIKAEVVYRILFSQMDFGPIFKKICFPQKNVRRKL